MSNTNEINELLTVNNQNCKLLVSAGICATLLHDKKYTSIWRQYSQRYYVFDNINVSKQTDIVKHVTKHYIDTTGRSVYLSPRKFRLDK